VSSNALDRPVINVECFLAITLGEHSGFIFLFHSHHSLTELDQQKRETASATAPHPVQPGSQCGRFHNLGEPQRSCHDGLCAEYAMGITPLWEASIWAKQQHWRVEVIGGAGFGDEFVVNYEAVRMAPSCGHSERNLRP